MSQRIAFIVKLRGISALLVYHHCHFFWMNPSFCGKLASIVPINYVPWTVSFLERLPINIGNLGVAIFFVMSGFLMPLAGQELPLEASKWLETFSFCYNISSHLKLLILSLINLFLSFLSWVSQNN